MADTTIELLEALRERGLEARPAARTRCESCGEQAERFAFGPTTDHLPEIPCPRCGGRVADLPAVPGN